MRFLVPALVLWCGSLAAAPALEFEVRVTGDDGQPMRSLEALDFEVKHGGKPQPIESFRFVDNPAGTKLYVAVETPPTSFPRIRQSLEQLMEKLPEGVEISLGGTPFTADKTQLSEYLAHGVGLIKQTPSAGIERLWRVNAMAEVQGRQAIDRYSLLAAQLARLPGYKRVVLFRETLRLESDGLDDRPTGRVSAHRSYRQNDADITSIQPVLDRFGAVALFSGVSFYPARISDSSAVGEQGLLAVAKASNGRPMLTPGDPGAIFDMVLEDSSDYYVLGIDPVLEGRGNHRTVKVAVNRKGVDVRSPSSYVDVKGLADLQGSGGGAEDLLTSDPGDSTIALSVSRSVFRGSDGRPLLLITAGAPAGSLTASDAKKGVSVDLTLAAGIHEGDDGWAGSALSRTHQVFDKKAFAAAQKGAGAAIESTVALAAPNAGEHAVRVVLRDDNGEQNAAEELRVAVPDFSKPLAAGSVLLTRRAVDINAKSEPPAWGDLLDFDKTRFIPESTDAFQVGDTVLFTFRLCNVPAELLAAPPEPQFAFVQGDDQVEGFAAQGRSRALAESEELQFMGAINTKGTAPGDYVVLIAVPQPDGQPPYVEAAFRLVE